MFYIKFCFSIILIFLMGLIGYERKKPKGIKPMKLKPAVIPPSYSCKPQPNLDTRELSASVKGYTVNPITKLVRKTERGIMEYLPSEKVSEISYNVKNQLTA